MKSIIAELPKIECPVCRQWRPAKDMFYGYKVVAVVNGFPSHGGVACKKCIAINSTSAKGSAK